MIKISEKTNKNEIVYIYEVIENNKSIYSEVISFSSTIRKHRNKDFLIIYSPEFKPISEAFAFLNYVKEKHALNSKIKSMQGLKLLFAFEKIIHKSLKDFTIVDINNLKYFLRGNSPESSKFSFNLKTVRNSDTINSYLAVYRQYAKFLNIQVTALFEKNSKAVIISYSDSDYTVEKYQSNEKTPIKIIEVPWYVSVEEFSRIIEEIRTNYSIVEELIVRLMFECGLRIGECLGLTNEDLIIEKTNDEFIPVGYIRNRMSDNRDQNAKTCMKVFSKKDYKTMEYMTFGHGYQKVIIPFNLYDLLNQYIEDTHTTARKINPTKYYSNVMADNVTSPYDEENFYIFLNSQFSPITGQLWNIRLRKIFNSVGIKVDEVKRKHNLNHRFRHGFAMFHIKHLKYNKLELKERLRHRSVSSVEKYYKPTISDSVSIKTDFANNLYTLIPSLERGDIND
jgi:integrase/recombinase XerD